MKVLKLKPPPPEIKPQTTAKFHKTAAQIEHEKFVRERWLSARATKTVSPDEPGPELGPEYEQWKEKLFGPTAAAVRTILDSFQDENPSAATKKEK